MKYYKYIFVAFILLLWGCAGQDETKKEIKMNPAEISACSNEVTIANSNEFMGETVSNLTASAAGNSIAVTFDVRTLCSSQLSADLVLDGNKIQLKLRNMVSPSGNCVCNKRFSTTVTSLSAGTYSVMVTNYAGNQILEIANGIVVQ